MPVNMVACCISCGRTAAATLARYSVPALCTSAALFRACRRASAAQVSIDADADVLNSPEFQAALQRVEDTPGLFVSVGGGTTTGMQRARSASHLPSDSNSRAGSPPELRMHPPRHVAEVCVSARVCRLGLHSHCVLPPCACVLFCTRNCE